MVHVDNLRLQQLLTNLLTNAAKFTEKGEINLSFQLEPDRKKVCIAVTDTGAGIPLEKQATIFNRFEKAGRLQARRGFGALYLSPDRRAAGRRLVYRLFVYRRGSLRAYPFL